ncbi:hypothetical protein HPB48_008030 [Haemaphysalis longicornis]|uniref:Uncharacterized protein n=1 Tax=Haemaphysalis longicornis TaxID=44386 RepID=A0A9J6G0Y9_HAELO|nr:hypothetical protein HPB48_008030 [Haemaphysalis longicornis]
MSLPELPAVIVSWRQGNSSIFGLTENAEKKKKKVALQRGKGSAKRSGMGQTFEKPAKSVRVKGNEDEKKKNCSRQFLRHTCSTFLMSDTGTIRQSSQNSLHFSFRICFKPSVCALAACSDFSDDMAHAGPDRESAFFLDLGVGTVMLESVFSGSCQLFAFIAASSPNEAEPNGSAVSHRIKNKNECKNLSTAWNSQWLDQKCLGARYSVSYFGRNGQGRKECLVMYQREEAFREDVLERQTSGDGAFTDGFDAATRSPPYRAVPLSFVPDSRGFNASDQRSVAGESVS